MFFVNSLPYINKVSLSNDGNYLLVSSADDAKLFHKIKGGYKLTRYFDLAERTPEKILVSNNGNSIFYGSTSHLGSGVPPSDVVYVYDKEGEKIQEVSASDVLSKEQILKSKKLYQQLDTCPPPSPWVCKTSSMHLFSSDNDTLVVYDTLQGEVFIDLETGEINSDDIYHNENGCSMFD